MPRMTELARRLGLGDAVVSCGVDDRCRGVRGVGAGDRAGGRLAVRRAALAALVAWCNATSSAQLAATYLAAGGTYVYGREELGPWWGFLAG